jgi:hypothetical protein
MKTNLQNWSFQDQKERWMYTYQRLRERIFSQLFSVDLPGIAKWFNEYEMDSLELKIESIINSPETTKIILGSKGENNSALTVVLKPRNANSSINYNYANQPQVPSDHVG